MMNSVLTAVANGSVAGALLTIALWVVLRAIPRRVLGANARYAAWYAALVFLMLLPLAYWPGGYRHAVPAQVVRLKQAVAPPRPLPQANLRNKRVSRPSETGDAFLKLPFTIAAGSWQMWFVAGWSLLSIAMIARLVMSFIGLARRKAEADLAPGELQGLLTATLAKRGSKRRARVLRSKNTEAPALAGVWKPAILIPNRLFEELTAEEINQIVTHEAAHLARWDDWGLLASRTIEFLLPFHPAAFWIVRQIDCEREIACDDAVVESTGDPRSYAACLIRVAEICSGAGGSWAAAQVLGRRGQWMRRVERLLDRKLGDDTYRTGFRLWSTTAVLAAFGLIACRMPDAIAFKRPQAKPAPTMAGLKVVPASQSGAASSKASLIVRVRPRTVTYQEAYIAVNTRDSPGSNDAPQGYAKNDAALQPQSIELVIDTSGSMRDWQQLLDRAVTQIVRASNPADEFVLVNFNSDAQIAGVFGNDAAQILDRQHARPVRGGTSLRDAILLAENWRQARNRRRKIVVISDGTDNSSSETTERLREAVRATGIPIWAITFADPAAYPKHESEWLRETAASTGGSEFVALDPNQIAAFATAIAK